MRTDGSSGIRSRLWIIAAGLFTAVNFFGAFPAAYRLQVGHFLLHVVLAAVGALILRALLRQRDGAAVPAALPDERMQRLQQSLDAVAVEVERMGEAQRYLAKLAAERGMTAPPAPQPPRAASPPDEPER